MADQRLDDARCVDSEDQASAHRQRPRRIFQAIQMMNIAT